MSEAPEFKTWAIVEVMGHVEYAGYADARVQELYDAWLAGAASTTLAGKS